MQDRRENAAANGFQVAAKLSAREIFSVIDTPTDNDTVTRSSSDSEFSRETVAAKHVGRR